MALGGAGGSRERLGVIPMALALVLAAVAGAALGFVWQSSGLGEEDEAAQTQAQREELLEADGAN